MLRAPIPPPTFFDVKVLNTIQLQPGSFYRQLAEAGPGLWPDELLANLYSQDHGRPGVPSSQMV